MTRLVWLLAWIGVAFWSLLCWATYGIFDIVGRFAMRNADAVATDPNIVEGIWRLLSALHSLSTGAVVVVWAVVSLLILAVPWVIDLMVGRAVTGAVGRPGPSGMSVRQGRGGETVIDLAPDQYTVGPATTPGAAAPGPIPRINPRG